MSLRRTLEELEKRPPRLVRLIEAEHEGPVGERPLTERQLANRIEPMLPHIASGHVALTNDTIARAVGRVMERKYKESEDASD